MIHYLLAIHRLRDAMGRARVTDVATHMKLTKGSVSAALAILLKKQLIQDDGDKFFSLTEEGHRHVHRALSGRTLLYFFLHERLGVSEREANHDACAMEHLMGRETVEALFRFMKSNPPARRGDLNLDSFKNFDEFMSEQRGDTRLFLEDMSP